MGERKRKHGAIEYLIKWRGYDECENTWESEECLENCKKVLKAWQIAGRKGALNREKRAAAARGLDSDPGTPAKKHAALQLLPSPKPSQSPSQLPEKPRVAKLAAAAAPAQSPQPCKSRQGADRQELGRLDRPNERDGAPAKKSKEQPTKRPPAAAAAHKQPPQSLRQPLPPTKKAQPPLQPPAKLRKLTKPTQPVLPALPAQQEEEPTQLPGLKLGPMQQPGLKLDCCPKDPNCLREPNHRGRCKIRAPKQAGLKGAATKSSTKKEAEAKPSQVPRETKRPVTEGASAAAMETSSQLGADGVAAPEAVECPAADKGGGDSPERAAPDLQAAARACGSMRVPVATSQAWEQVCLTGRIPQSCQPFFRPGGGSLSGLPSAADASPCAARGPPAPAAAAATSAASPADVAEDVEKAQGQQAQGTPGWAIGPGGPVGRPLRVGDRLEVEAAFEEGEEPQWLPVRSRDQNLRSSLSSEPEIGT